jgi:hypothetical protein
VNRIVESPLYLPAILIIAALGEGIIEAVAKLVGG